MSKKKIATRLFQKNGSGEAWVYKVDPPMKGYDGKEYEYVWVSAANAMFSGPETYIFPCDESGEVIDWGELDGSYRGGLSHSKALKYAGYKEVIPDEDASGE